MYALTAIYYLTKNFTKTFTFFEKFMAKNKLSNVYERILFYLMVKSSLLLYLIATDTVLVCSVCWESLFCFLDLTPVDSFFEHDLGGLNLGEGTERALANPEENNHEHDSKETIRAHPLVNVHVGVVGVCVGACEEHCHRCSERGHHYKLTINY